MAVSILLGTAGKSKALESSKALHCWNYVIILETT